MIELQLGGERLQLLPALAAYLPEHHTLLLADVHLGKAQTFRRLGVPVPVGTSLDTLHRLRRLVAQTGARGIVFLGDLLHAKHGLTPATVAAVQTWRQEHAALELTLVRGNHDQRAGDPPPQWHIRCVTEPFELISSGGRSLQPRSGLSLKHHPAPEPGRYVLAGHMHPAAILRGRSPGRLRLPCFHFGPTVGVLPAFGAFTGMHVMPRADGDRVYVVAGDQVHALP